MYIHIYFTHIFQEGNNIGTKKRESISKVLRELVNPKHGKMDLLIFNVLMIYNNAHVFIYVSVINK